MLLCHFLEVGCSVPLRRPSPGIQAHKPCAGLKISRPVNLAGTVVESSGCSFEPAKHATKQTQEWKQQLAGAVLVLLLLWKV
jgi:hypothetical protein